MAENLNGKTVGFWVENGEVFIELMDYEPVKLKPENVRTIAKTLYELAEKAEQSQRRELTINFDEIYEYLEQNEQPEPAPLTFAQTQAEPYRPIIGKNGKRLNGYGINLGLLIPQAFAQGKTKEELFQEIYGPCHWEEQA